MKDLIGQQFRRNKYGLSEWTKTIQQITYNLEFEKIEDVFVAIPKIKVSPDIKLSFNKDKYEWFDLAEIVLVSDKITSWGKTLEVVKKENRKISLKDIINDKSK